MINTDRKQVLKTPNRQRSHNTRTLERPVGVLVWYLWVGATLIPILYVRKLRIRPLRQFPRSHTTGRHLRLNDQIECGIRLLLKPTSEMKRLLISVA